MTAFDRAIAVTPHAADQDRYTAMVDPAWSALRGALGGYLTATAVTAAGRHLEGRSVRTVATSFLRPGVPGPAELDVRTLRAGRNVATVEVTMSQHDRAVLISRITAVSPVTGAEWDHGVPPAVVPPGDAVALAPPEGVIHFRQATAVLDPAGVPFTYQDRAWLGGHVRPLEPRPIDPAWLVMVLDWFPPSPFVRLDPPAGGVSVDYVVHLHHTLPAPLSEQQWLAAEFEAEISAGGLALEHGRIADPTGRLLAESFHTRWTA